MLVVPDDQAAFPGADSQLGAVFTQKILESFGQRCAQNRKILINMGISFMPFCCGKRGQQQWRDFACGKQLHVSGIPTIADRKSIGKMLDE